MATSDSTPVTSVAISVIHDIFMQLRNHVDDAESKVIYMLRTMKDPVASALPIPTASLPAPPPAPAPTPNPPATTPTPLQAQEIKPLPPLEKMVIALLDDSRRDEDNGSESGNDESTVAESPPPPPPPSDELPVITIGDIDYYLMNDTDIYTINADGSKGTKIGTLDGDTPEFDVIDTKIGKHHYFVNRVEPRIIFEYRQEGYPGLRLGVVVSGRAVWDS